MNGQGIICECDNCGHRCRESQLDEAKDLHERLDYPLGHPNCIEPAGECPKCGALSYEIFDNAKKVKE